MKSVLYIAPFAQRDVSGGSVTRMANLAALKASGYTVNVFYVNLEKKTIRKQLDALIGFKAGLNYSRMREVMTVIKASCPDFVFLDTSLFGVLVESIKKKYPEIRIITFFHNCEYSLYSLSLVNKNAVIRKILLDGVARNERLAMLCSDMLIFLTDRDRLDCEKRYEIHASEYAFSPMALEDSLTGISNETYWNSKPSKLLFVGSYFFPNINGLIWFDHTVLPRLNCTLRIVGRGFDNEDFLSKLENRGKVESVGFVRDLNIEYQLADIVIQPIFEGSGMKTKTAECLMHGKPLVSTSEGLEGYELDGLPDVYRCDNADSFIECLERLMQIGVPSFSHELRNAFLDRYSTSSRVQKYNQILMDLTND